MAQRGLNKELIRQVPRPSNQHWLGGSWDDCIVNHGAVGEALQRVLVTLTNSASMASPTPLERAGRAEFFERNFSVEAVERFKPAP